MKCEMIKMCQLYDPESIVCNDTGGYNNGKIYCGKLYELLRKKQKYKKVK